MAEQPPTSGDVTVVVATQNRWDQLQHTLPQHEAPVILVDNGSHDGTPQRVRERFPHVRVIELGTNRGAPARNVGAAAADTPFVAFADDDSWWAPGSLQRAAALLRAHPSLALVGARVLVGPDERLDPVSEEMAASALGRRPYLPGPSVLGFLACAAVVRRDAYLRAGGYDDVVFFFGEEERLALDLAAAGWDLCYVDEVVVHHHPSASADRRGRDVRGLRNRFLTAVMRRPPTVVAATAGRMLATPEGRRALQTAQPALRQAFAARRRLPRHVTAQRRRLDAARA
jgi:GT2 family glycosyltransferase